MRSCNDLAKNRHRGQLRNHDLTSESAWNHTELMNCVLVSGNYFRYFKFTTFSRYFNLTIPHTLFTIKLHLHSF